MLRPGSWLQPARAPREAGPALLDGPIMPKYPHVFLDIDTQHDFMKPDGRLYVPQADTLIPNLAALIRSAERRGIPLISSADAHAPDDAEFAEFPPHCVAGTPGQQKLPETLLDPRAVIKLRDSIPDFEALLDGNKQLILEKTTFDVFSNPNAARLVEQLDVGEYVVFGVATDYCVKAAVLRLLDRGKRVALVEDAIKPVTPAGGRTAYEEMRRRGARRSRTAELTK